MRQRGAALLIAVMLLFAFAVLGALTASSISGSGATDTNYQGGSVEALYAAETGMERALKQFASSGSTTATACTGLGGTDIQVAPGSTRTFTTTNFTTGFNLATLPFTQCRVRVVSNVPSTNATRTVQAILDRNLLGGENWAFNLPLGATTNATDWTVTTGPPTPGPRYDYTGGPEDALTGSGSRCTRAAYAVKSRGTGAGNAASMSTVLPVVPNFSVTPPQTITVRFNYRVILIGNSGNNNCASNTGVVPPVGTANNHLSVWISVTDTGANTFTTAGAAVFGAVVTNPGAPLNARTVTSANNCAPTTQIFPGDYAACSTHYGAGTTTSKGSTTVSVSGGTGIIASATLFIYLRSGGAFNDPREAWVDNIEFIANTGKLVALVGEWRDCAVTACP